MEHLSNDHKDPPNQNTNIQKICDEKRHPFLTLAESQWKLTETTVSSEFCNGGKATVGQILGSGGRNKSKE